MSGTDSYLLATREEFDLAVEWAAKEGWNPGLGDADIFWETDPEGFVCVERGGEVIATGSIVSYGGFGFMGFFIVREDLRGQGIGRDFWYWRRDRLMSRLEAGAAIGMDGVFAMQPFYAKGGFTFTHRNLRMEGVGQAGERSDAVVSLSDVPFEEVNALDTECFGFERSRFLKRWVSQEGSVAYGYRDGGALRGFGVVRKCLRGFKVGPLFAETEAAAEVLFVALSDVAVGDPIFLDTPENNPAAMRLAQRHGLSEVFGCARMYLGSVPELPWDCIYGVTTFELG